MNSEAVTVRTRLLRVCQVNCYFFLFKTETQVFGKEINKEKNKGLLAAALSDDEKETGDNSDDSIAEGN